MHENQLSPLVYVRSSVGNFTECRIEENFSKANGAFMYISTQSSVTVTDSYIGHNTA